MLRAWRQSPRLRTSPLQPKFSFKRYYSPEAPKPSRLDRFISKLPRRLQAYTVGLRNAPGTHVAAFLTLHEITAIVPLFALFGLFHYTNYVPVSYMMEHFGASVRGGVSKFERYFSRKGWFGFSKEDAVPNAPESDGGTTAAQTNTAVQGWMDGDQKYQILVEVALAYAITKVLLPIRIVACVWATPRVAGWMSILKTRLWRLPHKKNP